MPASGRHYRDSRSRLEKLRGKEKDCAAPVR